MNCLLCGGSLKATLSFSWVLSWQRVQDNYLCSSCRREFVRIAGATCSGCGRRWPGMCPDCRQWQAKQAALLCNRALYVYNNAMRTYMQRYKFQGIIGSAGYLVMSFRLHWQNGIPAGRDGYTFRCQLMK